MCRFVLLLAMVVSSPAMLAAQELTLLATGSRVRVTAPALWAQSAIGVLGGISPEQLTLVRTDDRDSVVVPLAAIERIEVSVGRWRRAPVVTVGALAGLLLGVATGTVFNSQLAGDCADCEDGIVMIPLVLGMGGLGGGALVGAVLPLDNWRSAQLPR